MEPTKETAEQVLLEAEQSNPGPWADHSRYVAQACRNIAQHCADLSAERAYILGLLHDIGRYAGVSQEKASDRWLSLLCGTGLGESGTNLHFPCLYDTGYQHVYREI